MPLYTVYDLDIVLLIFWVLGNRMCKYVMIRFSSNRSKFLKRGVMS